MTHALGMRAMSLGVSSALLGLIVFAAMTASYTVQMPSALLGPPSIIPVVEPPEPPPPVETVHTPRTPLANPIPSHVDELPAPNDSFPQELTTIVFGGADEGPVEITAPHWLRRPSDLGDYYPRRALTRGVEGVVELDCIVRVTGALDCAVARETPQGWGFGEAALRISRDHRMVPAERGGAPVEGRYRMRTPFNLN